MDVALVMKYVVNYCQEEQWCLQLYITNKMSTSVLKVGMPSGSEAFKRRLAFNATVIISTFYYVKYFITKALEYKAIKFK